ncbi:MAG: phosphate-starvation-inducible PsiE family protein [Acidithiobacillus sp.]
MASSENRVLRHSRLGNIIRDWAVLSAYERLEQVVALVLSAIFTVVILLSLWSVFHHLLQLLLHYHQDQVERQITALFGSAMGLLIAMEFNHTIFHSVMRRGQIVKVKTVVLIAILAISRQFILIENTDVSTQKILAYALATLVLGIVYYLIDRRDDLHLRRAYAQAAGGRGDGLAPTTPRWPPTPPPSASPYPFQIGDASLSGAPPPARTAPPPPPPPGDSSAGSTHRSPG